MTIFADSKCIFSVVHGHGVIFLCTIYLMENLLTFTYSIFCFVIKIFLVIDINNKYF
jgi:hypothetical protein